MNKLVRVVVFLGALLLVLAVMALLGTRSGERRALQKYQAELTAKGEKLTFAELTRGRQTNAVDSHTLLTNATAKLGDRWIVPGLVELRRYVRPGRASVAWRQASARLAQSAEAGDTVTWEEFAAQLQASQDALQEIREALKHPGADAGPYTNMVMGQRVNFVAIRMAAQWLMGAAENELHQGRLEAGLQDLEAMTALARMERNEPTLEAQMIRVALAGLGLAATWDALQAPDWTEPQLARLQAAWEPVDLVDALETGGIGERACGVELFAIVRHSSGNRTGQSLPIDWGYGSSSPRATFEGFVSGYLSLPAYKLISINADEIRYLKTSQETVVALRLLKAHRPWPDVKQALLKAGPQLIQRASLLGRLRYPFSTMAIPDYIRASSVAIKVETERQMTLAAIALRRSQLRHDKQPPSLEALVPEFLPAVPYDYMSAKPLRYRLKPDGNYVLYSVGLDGKDDGGDPNLAPSATPGLWGGRDAVWPSPVTEPEEPHRPRER